jgi:hypothetical protein
MSRSERRRQRQAQQLEKQRKRAEAEFTPHPQKQPKTEPSFDPEKELVQWTFEVFDHNLDWRKDKSVHAGFCEIGDQLKSYSQRTWGEIRLSHKRDHPIPCDQLCPRAQGRLRDLKLDDIDELWRFRFSNTRRLWGIKDGRLMKVVWWDPDHEVYPTQPHNT